MEEEGGGHDIEWMESEGCEENREVMTRSPTVEREGWNWGKKYVHRVGVMIRKESEASNRRSLVVGVRRYIYGTHRVGFMVHLPFISGFSGMAFPC